MDDLWDLLLRFEIIPYEKLHLENVENAAKIVLNFNLHEVVRNLHEIVQHIARKLEMIEAHRLIH